MEIISIVLFFVLIIGLGYSAQLFLKQRDVVDTMLLSCVLGLAIMPVLLFVLRLLHIPIDLRILLLLAVLGPVYGVWRGRGFAKFSGWRRVSIIVIVLAAVVALTSIMYIGAQKYPYLENDDPWAYAAGAHYVAIEKTIAQPIKFTRYLEPYPPYYTGLMGVLHQTTNDLSWVLKFFNALIIGLTLLAAFYAFESLLQSEIAAAGAAIILGAIPGYMSHFIWSQTLAILVFLVTLWALDDMRRNESNLWDNKKRKWKDFVPLIIPALLVMASTITQPSTAAIFAMFFVIFALVDMYYKKSVTNSALAVVLGGILSAFHWVFMLIVYGSERFFSTLIVSGSMFTSNALDTSGGAIYTLKEFLFPPLSSKIDQAVGIGWAPLLLVAIVIVVAIINVSKLKSEKNFVFVFGILLFILTLIGTQGNALPIKLFPHRFWVLLAIAVALLVGEALKIGEKAHKDWRVGVGIVLLVVTITVITLLPARLAVQQAMWPPGVVWSSQEQLDGFAQLGGWEPSRVYGLCGLQNQIIGFNHHAAPWTAEHADFVKTMPTTTENILAFLRSQGYDYVIVDSSCIRQYGANATIEMLQGLGQSGQVNPVIQHPPKQPAFFVLQVN